MTTTHPLTTDRSNQIEKGFCQCGCGGRTKVNRWNDSSQNRKKGEYRRFKQGHHPVDQKRGAESPRWKGDDVGYDALHAWVKKHLGRPQVCSDCGTTTAKRFDWANISGEYKRDLKDWKRLCTKCHRRFDGHIGEGHPSAKLTKKDVIEIRKLYVGGKYSQQRIGKMFNVRCNNISSIVNRNTWKHIK